MGQRIAIRRSGEHHSSTSRPTARSAVALASLALIAAAAAHADEGFYSGRSLAIGTPALVTRTRVDLAFEAGSAMLAEDGARLGSDRTFGGYRFGPGFALEGAQTRFGGPVLQSSGEMLSLAGVSSVPLSESLTLLAKFGLHYPQNTVTGGGLSVSDLAAGGKLYGLGLSYQVAENVELRAQSERYLHSQVGQAGAATVDTFLLGANVRF